MQSSVLWCFHLSSVLVHCSASSEVPKQWCTGVCCCMGLSAEVSSPHLVLHKYALHPSGLRYGSGGKNPPKPRLLGVTSLSGVQNIFLGNTRKKCMENISVVC